MAGPAADTGDELMQRPPWAACEYCHGDEGRIDAATVPAIAGQSASYIAKQLADFRAGRRSSPQKQMRSAVMLLDAAEDAAVAAYFADRPTTQLSLVQPARNGPGADLYWRGGSAQSACVVCHAASRDQLAAGRPFLFGLNADYLIRQLRAFRAGLRDNDLRGVMRQQAATLSDRQIAEVAGYLAGQELGGGD